MTKLVYIKYVDPVSYSDDEFKEADLILVSPSVNTVGGIVLLEDKNKIIIGEISRKEDNLTISELTKHPTFRYVMAIHKKAILKRIDFDVEEEKA